MQVKGAGERAGPAVQRRGLSGEHFLGSGEGLELERIAIGIEEEHRCLFARLAGKAQRGFHDKADAGGAQAPGK